MKEIKSLLLLLLLLLLGSCQLVELSFGECPSSSSCHRGRTPSRVRAGRTGGAGNWKGKSLKTDCFLIRCFFPSFVVSDSFFFSHSSASRSASRSVDCQNSDSSRPSRPSQTITTTTTTTTQWEKEKSTGDSSYSILLLSSFLCPDWLTEEFQTRGNNNNTHSSTEAGIHKGSCPCHSLCLCLFLSMNNNLIPYTRRRRRRESWHPEGPMKKKKKKERGKAIIKAPTNRLLCTCLCRSVKFSLPVSSRLLSSFLVFFFFIIIP